MSYQSVVLSNTPNLYYRLQDSLGSVTAADSSASGNTGNVVGGVTFGQTGPWNGDTSALLNGTTGYIKSTSAPSAMTTFTWESWASLASLPNAGRYVIGLDNADWLGIDGTNKPKVSLVTGVTQFTAGSSSAMTLGSFYHMVATYDGANLTLYVNGSQAAQTAVTGTPRSGFANYLVGQTAGVGFWPGNIAEVAIYPFALTAAQVWQHYTAYTPASNISPGSQRPFTLQDVISSLNSGVQNANSPDLSIDNTSTQMLSVAETTHISDGSQNTKGSTSAIVSSMSGQTFNDVTWGEALWTS